MRTLIAVFSILLSVASYAQQWSTVDASNNMHSMNSGNVGIGATTPTAGKLQIGDANNGFNYKLVIPGNYNFEKIKFGQYGNGAAGLEFINHTNSTYAYGVRFLANVDQAQGLQFQYAPAVTAEGSLTYTTAMFMSGINGNVGIGTTAPDTKLHIVTTAATSTRESLFKGTVSDAGNDACFFYNGTSANGSFMPSFGGIATSATSRPALNFTGFTTSANDAGVNALVRFDALQTTSVTDPANGTLSAVINRPLFSWSNNGAVQMTMLANGNIGIGTTNPQSLLAVKGTVTAQKVVVM